MQSSHAFSIHVIATGILLCLAISFGAPFKRQVLAFESEPLKIALLPILDTFPFYVAAAGGYFEKEGIRVKAVPVGSGLERDQLMQAGAIDGMLNEIMSAANFNRTTVQVKIVMVARKTYPGYPLFRLLSAPGSHIDTPGQLAGHTIGIAKNTIIEYVTDRLLAEANVPAARIVKQSIPVIPERYQLLMQGRLQAATLPDPLAKSAITAGAGLVVDDAAYSKYSLSVLTFSVRSLMQRPEDVRRFLKAWDRAVADINASPNTYRDLLLQKIRVPQNIQQHYQIPPYPRKEVPENAQWMDVMDWMVSRGLLSHPLAYKDSVVTHYLP